jgi:hypothetical protein
VTTVNRQLHHPNFIDRKRFYSGAQLGFFLLTQIGSNRLDQEQSGALMLKESAPPNELQILNDAFHGERIDQASLVMDFRGASSKEPKAALVIEIASVSGAMPYEVVHSELCFPITRAVEVTAQNMGTLYDDLAWLTGRALHPSKFALSHRIDWVAPTILNHGAPDSGNRLSCEQPAV